MTILICSIFTVVASAQTPLVHTHAANRLYKQKKFNMAVPEYEKAVQLDPGNPVNNYNLGNAYFRMEKYDDGIKFFEKAAEESNDGSMKQRAYYNKGVSFSRENKLEESIQAYKSAVILNPADSDARINLQKALLELKKKSQPEKEKKKDENKKQKKKNEKEPPPKSKMTKKQVEQLLKALQQREQQVQQKMLQNRTRATTKPEKDW